MGRIVNRVGLCAGASVVALGIFMACSSDPSGGPDVTTDAGSGADGSPDGSGVDAGKRVFSVECSHPGAGAKREDGLCDCELSAGSYTGDWNGLYTCRTNKDGSPDGGTCFDQDKAEAFTFTQTDNKIAVYEGPAAAPTFRFDGIVCKEWFTWAGGPTDKTYTECGTIRFTDPDHFVKDSCYQEKGNDGGACKPAFAAGCVGQSGQCTNTGARTPATAAPIEKNICK